MPSDLIINLDQTRLSYMSPGKYTFNLKGAKNLSIKDADNKRQITATFVVSATGNFLPIQLVYTGKTKICFPNVEFPRSFHVMYTEKYWPNQLKATEHLEKVIFPYLGQIKENIAYPKEQMSLVAMDTFKGQGNNDSRELCAKNNCEIVIISHNLTNKPLDLNVNKPVRF